jgi:cysteine synthase
MACALAYYGKLLGYSASVVVSSKITLDKWNFIKYFGANITKLGDFTIQGNQFCRELAEREGDRYCFLDQLHNWANPRAHYETTGPEILSDFPNIAMVVGSLGSGGSLAGTAQFLKENRPGVKIVAVQSALGTKIPGTGSFDDGDYITPFIKKATDERLFDHTIKIGEEDAVRKTILLRDQGVFGGLQTGGVLHAALTVARELEVEGDVVALSGDTGWKNMEKLISLKTQ